MDTNPTTLPASLATAPVAGPWREYAVDAAQRGVLFLDALRRRGNQQAAITARPSATVLRFGHEVLISGHGLKRPINYSLSRILPPPGVTIDPRKRPVVVIDPRAGQGPGIGGFKPDSEIGDALNAGHPVYFIHFSAQPEPDQGFLDVVEGQVMFFERIRDHHPDAPPAFAIGNCQAGYQTLMVAALRPDLFGPVMVAGSPMSYWQGVRGKNPMRYTGGLLGGSWLTALTSDLGNGKFDGAWLILNFDVLNPGNWLWGKQYGVYANVDTEAGRYLEFEKWWGDFVVLNGREIQFLVDQLFIGDKLTRNRITSSDGKVFDLRAITAPIIVFTSFGDNISPPQQTLGWILDLYRDVADIRARERTIVYCLDQTAGHLAIFVSAKVGAKEDEEILRLMDMIDCLPPGLYELVITPRPAGSGGGAWLSRIEARSLDDIRALGRNSVEDDRAFAAAARVSEINLSLYRTFWQPAVKAMVSQPMADAMMKLHPLRLGYTMFADGNPWMKAIAPLASEAARDRTPATGDNPFLTLQRQVSDRIVAALDAWRDMRDSLAEQVFFSVYGSPIVQGLLGLNTDEPARGLPGVTAEEVNEQRAYRDTARAEMTKGTFGDALIRAMLYVASAERSLDERCAAALSRVLRTLGHLTPSQFKAAVRDQFEVLLLAREDAVDALAAIVPDAADRAALLENVRSIVGAPGGLTPGEQERLARLDAVLGAGARPPAGPSPRQPRAAPVAGV
ncbi:MAG TPA: DUF3141 domain-containing protein [Rhodopila sp.]|uniref:DUF3141 domain-containing protein n=1 Tax=Rhodopila sp. TaxID=2480087 RepID=UPI002C67339A|nr:DUF3141 domain-containing protein [Rhodopila sp.]HVY14611.1 DUF3141 domain-containing protein [Rhodopila sp.]